MLLYHFTRADKASLIKESGLRPGRVDPFVQAIGHPVVWLTSQRDVSVAAAAAAKLAQLGSYEAPLQAFDLFKAGKLKGIPTGPPTRWLHGSKSVYFEVVRNGRKIGIQCVPDVDDLVRISVEVPDDGRLHRYIKWPHRPRYPLSRVVDGMPHVRAWWVYEGALGTISEVTAL